MLRASRRGSWPTGDYINGRRGSFGTLFVPAESRHRDWLQPQAPRAHRLIAPLHLQLALFPDPARLRVWRLAEVQLVAAYHQLAGARRLAQPMGDVDRIADRGEAGHLIGWPEEAREGEAGVEADPDRQLRLAQDAPGRGQAVLGMQLLGEGGDEERHHAVSQELVDDPALITHRIGHQRVEAAEEHRELGGG
jgi:hypothetical protein